MSFADAEFPPNDNALYHERSSSYNVTEWSRPVQYCPAPPALFVDGCAPGDVIQGGLGDCYFLGAASVVALDHDALSALFVESNSDEGLGTNAHSSPRLAMLTRASQAATR